MNSHAEGRHTKACSSYQHVQGKYNIEDSSNTYAHIVGNGDDSDNALSNAHTLDWSGNAWFAGDVYTGSTSGTNKDEGSKKLATEEYVDGRITEDSIIIKSSTPDSTKKFKITVDDSGTPSLINAEDSAEVWSGATHSAYAAAQAGGYTDTQANFYADLAAVQGLAAELAAI